MSVAPRWKRRADEIAEAIGDELSINGTVSIGNDVTLSVATITALATAITNVLNPLSIAASVWGVYGDYGVCRATQDPSDQNYWMVYSSIGHQVSHIHDSSGTTISPSANSSAWVYRNNNQWQLFNGDVVRNVSVLSTIQQPVHVELKNVTGGFTALATNVSNAMKLSPVPVSIGSTVNVKTATNEAVAITGSVNLNVGTATVPISNPNSITVPVVNSANVTVPVNVGSATVPVRASANGTPQNSSGVNVLVSVNPTHSVTVPVSVGSATVPASVPAGLTVPASVASNLTVPVAVGGATVPAYVPNTLTVPASVPVGLTVPVAVGSNTVPVAVGSATVPVANTNSIVVPVENTNNVTIPVTASGTVLNVKIVEVADIAKTTFHEAVETALDDATGINVVPTNTHLGYIHSYEGNGTTGYQNLGGWVIVNDAGTKVINQYFEPYGNGWLVWTSALMEKYRSMRVVKNGAFSDTGWTLLTTDATLRTTGYVLWNNNDNASINSQSTWRILYSDGTNTGYSQMVKDENDIALFGNTRDQYTGRHVVYDSENNFWMITSTGTDRAGIFGTVTEMTNQGGADPWWKVVRFGETEPEPTIYGNAPAGVFVGLNVIKNSSGNWVPSYQYD